MKLFQNKNVSKKLDLKNKKLINWYLLPLILSVGAVPLICRLKIVQTNLSIYDWYSSSVISEDFFTYWKSIYFLIASVFEIIMLADWRVLCAKKLKWEKSFALLSIYAVAAILSTFFSVDKTISLKGILEQYESIWVLLGYLMIFYYAYCMVKTEKDVLTVGISLMISAGVISLIGLSQYVGHDFFGGSLGSLILFPESLKQYRDTVDFVFDDTANRVYATLCNPNYVGVYVVMLIPICIGSIFAVRKRVWKIYGMILLAALLMCMLGSGSRTALVVLGVLFLVMLILLSKVLFKNYRLSIGIFAVGAVCLVVIYMIVGGNVLHRLSEGVAVKKNSSEVEEIVCGQDSVKIVFCGKEFYIALNSDGMGCKVIDKDGKPVKVSYGEDGLYHVTEKRYRKLAVGTEMDEEGCFLYVKTKDKDWMFFKDSERDIYQFYTIYGKKTNIEAAESIGFSEYEKFLTNRGYIWSRTLPILPQRLILGSGPGTFALVFPQNDYVARRNTSEDLYKSHLLKPHNMYLQTAVQTGMVSLLCLLIFGGVYLIDSWKLYYRRESYTSMEIWGIALFFAVLGFALTGITNDSGITTAPVFWPLLGCGMSVNCINGGRLR